MTVIYSFFLSEFDLNTQKVRVPEQRKAKIFHILDEVLSDLGKYDLYRFLPLFRKKENI